jgi:hypothetical protein
MISWLGTAGGNENPGLDLFGRHRRAKSNSVMAINYTKERCLVFSRLASSQVRGAKPRASYVKLRLVALSINATKADFCHHIIRWRIMLHLRARGFAPLTFSKV